MPVDSINFLGINRAISDFSPSSACEEIINLRQSTNGLVPVKPFSTIMSNVECDKVITHMVTTGGINYFTLEKGINKVILKRVDEEGEYISTVYEFKKTGQTISVNALLDSIHFATAGNIILFSACDKTNNLYVNKSFIWKNGNYSEIDGSIPPISFNLSKTYDLEETIRTFLDDQGGVRSKQEFGELLENVFEEFQETNIGTCFGPIIIAIAFKTKDGETCWTGNWCVFDPIPVINSQTQDPSFPYYVDELSDLPGMYQPEYTDFFTKYKNGAYFISKRGYIDFAGCKVSLTFDRLQNWDDENSIVQSIEVYTSRPQLYIDTNAMEDGAISPEEGQSIYWSCILPVKKYNDMGLSDQLLYHQGSISLYDLSKAQQTLQLNFGGNIQLGNDTLEIDAGMVTRFGNLLSYNARFHYYDSISHIELGVPTFNVKELGNRGTARVIVRYSDKDRDELVYVGTTKTDTFYYDESAYIVIAPSINIKEVITCVPVSTNWIVAKYRMTESSSYNYSICTEGAYEGPTTLTSGLPQEYQNAIDAGIKGIDLYDTSAINVSEQYSPYIFSVKHSYLAPGRVLDIKPQLSVTQDISFGDYPLIVFTDRGLYALLQGSADVLYGSFRPISNLITQSNSVSTKIGTFFLAAGALWLISGIHTVLISDALSLGPHTYIRDNDGFKKISLGYGALPGSYTVATFLSTVPFKDYVYKESVVSEQTVISKATLSYNPYNEEIYVSNKDYNYTYALSTKHRQWFKLSGKIWQDVPGSNIANRPGASPLLLNVVDFSGVQEDEQVVVHIQSRPLSFAMQYSHIHRIVAMVRAELGFFSSLSYHSADTLVVALYGSDNLQDWSLLSYAQRAGTSTSEEIGGETVVTETPLKISQIRTPSASRSWRYYTICIGGKVHYDTDFGPVMIDYQPVIRRVG